MLQLLDLARQNAALKLELKRIRTSRRRHVYHLGVKNMATTYHVTLFMQVPAEGARSVASRAGAARCGRGTPLAGRQPDGDSGGESMIAAIYARKSTDLARLLE